LWPCADTEQGGVTGQTIVVDGGSTLSETDSAIERPWGIE
jgi:hypothetical protein